MTAELPDPLSNPAVRAIIEKMARYPFNPTGANADMHAIADNIEDLFREVGTEDVGEVMAAAVEQGLISPAQGGQFLEIATWGGNTNGAHLQPTIERWLEEAKDPLRIGLALAQPTFPFRSLDRMTTVLSGVGEAHPQYIARVRQLIDRRRQQGT